MLISSRRGCWAAVRMLQEPTDFLFLEESPVCNWSCLLCLTLLVMSPRCFSSLEQPSEVSGWSNLLSAEIWCTSPRLHQMLYMVHIQPSNPGEIYFFSNTYLLLVVTLFHVKVEPPMSLTVPIALLILDLCRSTISCLVCIQLYQLQGCFVLWA